MWSRGEHFFRGFLVLNCGILGCHGIFLESFGYLGSLSVFTILGWLLVGVVEPG